MRRILLISTLALTVQVSVATQPTIGQTPAEVAPAAVDSTEAIEDQPAASATPTPKPQPSRAKKDEPIEDLAADTATHGEVEPLGIQFKRLSAFRLGDDGCLVACDAEARTIKLIGPADQPPRTFELTFPPESLDLASDGTIFCGGQGVLAHLAADGSVICQGQVPDDAATSTTARRRGKTRPLRVSGIAVTEQDVFVAFGSGWSTGSKSKLYRLDRQFQNPLLLAEGLRGCCQRCDIIARDNVLYVAENSAHRVLLYDRDGQVLDKWGQRSRTELAGFGACCNPMNLAFDAHGTLYTAESGLGRIKRYTTDGQFLGLVGYVGTDRFWNGSGLAASCSNITIAVTPDGQRVYVMDYKGNQIRVLQQTQTVQ